MSTETPGAEGRAALDEALKALTLLRRRADEGGLGREELAQLADALAQGLLSHPLVQGVLADDAAPPGLAPAEGDRASQPAEGEGTDEVATSPHAEAEEQVAALAALADGLEGLGVRMPTQLADYLRRAGKLPASLEEDDRTGDQLAKVLFDGVGILDRIERSLVWSRHREPALARIEATRSSIAAFLHRVHGLGFVPDVGLKQVGADGPPEGVDVEGLPAPGPAGRVLWTEARAYRSGDGVQGRGKLRVAEPGGSRLRAWLVEAWSAIENDGGSDPRPDLEKLSRWIEELRDGDGRSESNTARHALNLMHGRSADGQHAKPLKWLIAFLKEHEVFVVPVEVGKTFDGSFSPSKFERRKERSSLPEGTILRVVTLGLVDRDGLPLQKAVLAVSSGD